MFSSNCNHLFLHSYILYCTQYSYLVQISNIYIIVGTLTGYTALDRCGDSSNDNEGISCILQISRIGASPPDAILCHTQDSIFSWIVCSRCILSFFLSFWPLTELNPFTGAVCRLLLHIRLLFLAAVVSVKKKEIDIYFVVIL